MRWGWLGVLFVAVGVARIGCITWMPGANHGGPSPPFTPEQTRLRKELAHHVDSLAVGMGERNARHPQALLAARQYIERSLGDLGYRVQRQEYVLQPEGLASANVEATRQGADHSRETVLLGAHYDSAVGTPGADDNASGVAVMLALARLLAHHDGPRTLRLVAFTHEEPPYFRTSRMGSKVYARASRLRNDPLVAALILDGLGCFAHPPGTQKYPSWLLDVAYPSRGDFVAFVGNTWSGGLVRQTIKKFREHAAVPSQGVALPSSSGAWSDNGSFWDEGYAAVLVTDTLLFRSPHYHTAADTPGTLDMDRMVLLTEALEHVVRDLLAH